MGEERTSVAEPETSAPHPPAGADGPCEVTLAEDRPDWSAYLERRADATIFHDPRWGGAMRRAYRNRPHYLTARRGDRVVGVLQLVEKRSLLFGHHLASLPYFDAAGLLADDAAAEAVLLEGAQALREQTGAAWVELRQAEPLAESLDTRTDKVTFVLGLPEDPEPLWEGLKSSIRNHVRKSRKQGCEAVQGGAELLEDFHGVYVRTMRDLGSPPHSLRFFRTLAETFGPAVRLFVVRQEGQVLAASFTLRDRHALRVPWSGSDWRFRKLSANMLLYWEMIETGCREGAGAFDFGRTTRGSGQHTFKKQWGGDERTLHWQYVLGEGGEPPRLDPESGKLRVLVGLWRKLPLWAARTLGPRIISKLS